jgi:hypothetical protein
MFLMYSHGTGGLSADEIFGLVNQIGLGGGATQSAQSFEDIMGSTVLTGLKPDQIAQVSWLVKGRLDTSGNGPLSPHAFLIGRLASGSWFLSDQGTTPPGKFEAADLKGLKGVIQVASATGQSEIYTGGPPSTSIVGGAGTGVRLLGQASGVEQKAADLIPVNSFLAEVDAGMMTIGSRVTARAFISRHYDFASAEKASDISDAGGAVVEMPEGVFNVYATSLVSDGNVNESKIDVSDSTGGFLAGHRFFHAWLRLRSEKSGTRSAFQIY